MNLSHDQIVPLQDDSEQELCTVVVFKHRSHKIIINQTKLSNPLQIFFKIVFPILKPTMISTAILETMWVWNDYLLPTLVLDIKKYRTIPMAIQYFRGSYGRVEMGPMMACIMITVLPIIVMYLVCQKYIIDGVIAGAVKG